MTHPSLFSENFWPFTCDQATSSKVALWAENCSVTYYELGERVKARCANYKTSNLSQGDRIVLLQERTLELCVDLVAAICAGFPVTILSRSESISVSIEKVQTINAARLIADQSNFERAEAISAHTGTTIELRNDCDKAPGCSQPETPEEKTEALIIFTSGSTGIPKGISLSQANIASNTYGLAQKIAVSPADHYIQVMPLSHTNGVLNQILLPLAKGARVTLLSHFNPRDFVAALEEHKPTIFTAVPTILSRLLDFNISRDVTDRLRFVRCGADQLLPELHRRVEEHFGVDVLVSYGQTENTCTGTVNPVEKRKIGSVGVVLPLQDLAILDTETDRELSSGKVGEVCFRGANVATEIIDFARLDPKSWLRTGDRGYVDDDGYLFLTGRLKDIIICGGNNLSPQQIENTLLHHEAVKSASVIGVPDADLGEVPVACIETSSVRSLDLADLNSLITEKLSSGHRLSNFFAFDVLPKNEAGKVDKKELLAQIITKMGT